MSIQPLAIGCLVALALTLPACRRASPQHDLPLTLLTDTLAICRLDAEAAIPAWATGRGGGFSSVTRTRDELSILLAESGAPADAKCERSYRALKVKGPLPFNLVGVFAGLTGKLSDAGVSILGFSTYDTDYVMVKQTDLQRSLAALRRAGYTVEEPQDGDDHD